VPKHLQTDKHQHHGLSKFMHIGQRQEAVSLLQPILAESTCSLCIKSGVKSFGLAGHEVRSENIRW
jgi:hypothetical protein